jgi:hypothetical protein
VTGIILNFYPSHPPFFSITMPKRNSKLTEDLQKTIYLFLKKSVAKLIALSAHTGFDVSLSKDRRYMT